MKKSLRILFLFCILIILTACNAKTPTISKKELNKSLIEKLVGSWQANSYDYGDYEIAYDGKIVDFNSSRLEVDYTEDNRVFTHQETDKSFHYLFEVNEEEIIVYRSYRIEQTSDELVSGGDLAPIELKKERTRTKDTILGQ